jgi:hypothetical protein
MSPVQALRKQKFGKRGAFAFEQPLKIARRQAEMRGNAPDREIPPVAVFDDEGLGHPEPRGRNPASADKSARIMRRAKSKRDKIVQVGVEG